MSLGYKRLCCSLRKLIVKIARVARVMREPCNFFFDILGCVYWWKFVCKSSSFMFIFLCFSFIQTYLQTTQEAMNLLTNYSAIFVWVARQFMFHAHVPWKLALYSRTFTTCPQYAHNLKIIYGISKENTFFAVIGIHNEYILAPGGSCQHFFASL